MARIYLPALGLLAAAPALAHEDAGLLHMHPHGGEAALAVAALTAVAAVLAWRVLRGRR